MKRCSISSLLEKCKSKLQWGITSYLVRMAIIKKSTNNKCWRGCGKKGALLLCWWECRLIQPLGRTVWRLLKKLWIKLPCAVLCWVASVMSDSCHPVDCRLPGSSIHGILQARILEWVAMSSSRGSSWPRDWTLSLCLLHWQAGSLLLDHLVVKYFGWQPWFYSLSGAEWHVRIFGITRLRFCL